jgi:hypothetical protein
MDATQCNEISSTTYPLTQPPSLIQSTDLPIQDNSITSSTPSCYDVEHIMSLARYIEERHPGRYNYESRVLMALTTIQVTSNNRDFQNTA